MKQITCTVHHSYSTKLRVYVCRVQLYTEIGEWLLRGASLALGHSQQVAHLDKQFAKATALILRQSQNAGHIVVLC